MWLDMDTMPIVVTATADGGHWILSSSLLTNIRKGYRDMYGHTILAYVVHVNRYTQILWR